MAELEFLPQITGIDVLVLNISFAVYDLGGLVLHALVLELVAVYLGDLFLKIEYAFALLFDVSLDEVVEGGVVGQDVVAENDQDVRTV